MKNIIVVDCTSTGINFIEDIVNRGYAPVVLELKDAGDDLGAYQAMLKSNYDEIDQKFDMIYERDTYEETLEEVRKLDPKLVLPGSEHGVILASKLANDLNLLCNPIENLDAMTLKHEMHNRLAEKGLRHIRGKAIRSVEEAIEFYDENSLGEVVIKPVYSAGSVAVRICSNRQEMIDSIEELFDKKDYYGGKIDELLIQDRIKGEEYIVNTVSCDGFHRVTLIWKYRKVKTTEGAIIYDTIETVNNLDIAEAEMIEYAYKVADAIGIRYGPVHGEYMIDDDGPVLIEVNCRPCGGHMPAKFLDRISGQHETDSILDSYLKPARFFEKVKQRYRLQAYGALKIFIVPEEILAKSAPITSISGNLKTFFKADFDNISDSGRLYVKTEDLNSTCGIVFLVHEDRGLLYGDIDFLRSIEKYAFALVLNPEYDKIINLDEEKIAMHLKNAVDSFSEYGTGLLITDQFIDSDNILQIGIDEIDSVNGGFDFIIVNLNKTFFEKKDDFTINVILSISKNIKVGGVIFVPKSTCDFVPGKRRGVEALMKDLDLRIEVPPYGIDEGVIATRNVIG